MPILETTAETLRAQAPRSSHNPSARSGARLASSVLAGLLAATTLSMSTARAEEPDTEAPNTPAVAAGPDAESENGRPELAPPGECARPRGLPDSARPSSFDIAGNPAARLVPAQVAGGSAQGAVGQRPGPPAPAPPSPGLCDHPASCTRGRPAVIEREPVPGLPPGTGARP